MRIVNNGTGHVFTRVLSGHSTMSIAPGQAGSTNFMVAAATETGAGACCSWSLMAFLQRDAPTVGSSCSASHAAVHDHNADGRSDIAWRNTNGGVNVEMNGTQILNLNASGLANVYHHLDDRWNQAIFNGGARATFCGATPAATWPLGNERH